jgi:hypothetical protein
MTAGTYRPTDVCDAGIADKLGIPAAYLKKMRASRPGLFDANVNGWLTGDDRSFFIRCLRGDDGGAADIARAWLSDGYKPIDHLDTLTAVFDGIRQSGYPVTIDSCDLTERRMYVRVRCEAVQVLAPALLSGYRSPFTGAAGTDNPVVFAGFVVANSETGCGACTVTPRLVAQVCANGMTITRDAVRAVHLDALSPPHPCKFPHQAVPGLLTTPEQTGNRRFLLWRKNTMSRTVSLETPSRRLGLGRQRADNRHHSRRPEVSKGPDPLGLRQPGSDLW